MKEQEQTSLREEFMNLTPDATETFYEADYDKIADWWLDKLHQQQVRVVESLEKEKERWNSNGEYYANVTEALDKAIEIVKKII